MNTDDLIERLADDLEPRRVNPRLLVALAMVALFGLSAAAMLALYGQPLAALPAISIAPYAMKLGFAGSLLGTGSLALVAAGSPGRPIRLITLAIAVPFAIFAMLAVLEQGSFGPTWFGATWQRCLASILGFGLVGLAAGLAVLRRLAPTSLALAGAMAGLCGGACAATAYGFWCPETQAQFLLLWYGGPILALAALGALLGPLALRW